MPYDATQPLFWYKPIFMLELLAAEMLFSTRLAKKNNFALRLLPSFAVCLGFAFALPIFPRVAYTAWYSSIMYLSMFAVSIAALRISYNGTVKDILFCAIAGYTVQHISQEAFELFNIAVGLNGKMSSDFYGEAPNETSVGTAAFSVLVYVSIFVSLYALSHMLYGSEKRESSAKVKNSYMVIVSLVIILVDAIISSIVTYSVPDEASKLPVITTHVYNIICCALVMFLLFELPKRMNAESELDVVRRIHHREKQQYLTAKENIDLINMKFHDLKHKIRTIGTDGDAAAELEDMIEVYDSAYKTGNDALDVILTEKSLLCHKLAIKLSCIADGAQMDFMKDADIYALFGNILDNAIEAVKSYDSEERVISVSVRAHNAFVIINARNACNHELVFKDGLPVTSKQNKEYHGFGMKSIKYIVEKYKGEMEIDAEKNIFALKIVFGKP